MRRMPKNMEIKARTADLPNVEKRAAQLQKKWRPEDEGPAAVLVQRDVFFNAPMARLKLRRVQEGKGTRAFAELISYKRADAEGPKQSDFVKVDVTAGADELEAALTASLGVKGVVAKRRHLFLLGPTRVHADLVEGLGSFVEIEHIMQDGEDVSDAEEKAKKVMDDLGVHREDYLAGAYMDLILKAAK